MAYPRELLNEGEEVLLDLRPHWLALLGPSFAVIGGIAIAALLPVFVALAGPLAVTVFVPLGLALILWLLRFATWRTSIFVITTERLIRRSGVVAKTGMEIPLDRVNNIGFKQTVIERMLGAGDLTIESAGEDGRQDLPDMRKPAQVQNAIYRAMESQQQRDADRMVGRSAPSLAEELEKLDALRQRGVLSDAEFAAQKAQLLGGS